MTVPCGPSPLLPHAERRLWVDGVQGDDPVTGRRFLTRSAYAEDGHLRSRMAIWSYAEVPLDRGWRLSGVPWDGTQGCGRRRL